MSEDFHQVSDAAQGLLRTLVLTDGVISLPVAAESAWADGIPKIRRDDRRAVALDLVAVAVRLRREGGESTHGVVGAFFRLVARLLDSEHDAALVFDAVGMADGRALAAVTGAAVSSRPVAADGAKPSLLDVRLGRTKASADDD